jgi:hypothetical protein
MKRPAPRKDVSYESYRRSWSSIGGRDHAIEVNECIVRAKRVTLPLERSLFWALRGSPTLANPSIRKLLHSPSYTEAEGEEMGRRRTGVSKVRDIIR